MAKKGKGAPHYRMSSKGANLQILGAIGANKGRILTEAQFVSVNQAYHDDWVKIVIDKTAEIMDISKCVFVIDNAPSHKKLEQRPIYQYMISRGADLLRLGPYSAPLNPIELYWNVMKSHVKQRVGENTHLLTNVPEGLTQKKHRGQLMVQWANEALDLITQEQCHAFTDCCEGRLTACILMQPLLA